MSVFKLLSKHPSISTPDGLIEEIISYADSNNYTYVLKLPPFKYTLSTDERDSLNLFISSKMKDEVVIPHFPESNVQCNFEIYNCISHILSMLPHSVGFANSCALNEVATNYLKNKQVKLFQYNLIYHSLFTFYND